MLNSVQYYKVLSKSLSCLEGAVSREELIKKKQKKPWPNLYCEAKIKHDTLTLSSDFVVFCCPPKYSMAQEISGNVWARFEGVCCLLSVVSRQTSRQSFVCLVLKWNYNQYSTTVALGCCTAATERQQHYNELISILVEGKDNPCSNVWSWTSLQVHKVWLLGGLLHLLAQR